jgi:DNA/RNA endonuclease YhcR with UshA esterase domain
MRASFLSLLFCFLSVGTLIAADITPDVAVKHVGEVVTVRGTVAQVFLSKGGNAYLNFGAAYPNQSFSADVLAKQTPQLLAGGTDWLTAFEGRVVVVTGKIQLYKGKPEIVITAREDVSVAK